MLDEGVLIIMDAFLFHVELTLKPLMMRFDEIGPLERRLRETVLPSAQILAYAGPSTTQVCAA